MRHVSIAWQRKRCKTFASNGEEVKHPMKARLIYLLVIVAVLAAFLAEFADPFSVGDGHL